MRSRSKTIYMKENPFKKSNSSPATPTSNPTVSTATNFTDTSSKCTPEYADSVFDCFGPMSTCKVKDVFSGDYQGSCSHDNLSNASTSIDGFRSRGISRVSVDDFLEIEEPAGKASKIFRAMVIGARNAEKYSLVNTLYPGEECGTRCEGAKFDLVTRTIDKENFVERYHFWLKEAGHVDRKHRALLDVYYRTCSAFFLVYNEEDRESFECLESEIDMIKEDNGDREVMLVLICNKDKRGTCSVALEEVQQLVGKYKIRMALDGEELFTRQEEVKEMISSLIK